MELSAPDGIRRHVLGPTYGVIFDSRQGYVTLVIWFFLGDSGLYFFGID
jgi:hypothetical protein